MKTASLAALAAMKRVYERPGTWCQWAAAKNADGARVVPVDPSAVCHCLAGLACLIQPYALSQHVWSAIEATLGVDLVTFNDADGRTQAEVVDAIDRTIKRLEAQSTP